MHGGERRLPACTARQLAGRQKRASKQLGDANREDAMWDVRGKLPRTAGWQPALPKGGCSVASSHSLRPQSHDWVDPAGAARGKPGSENGDDGKNEADDQISLRVQR